MNRWTIKELNETDDLTFAMCILSERREMLNQEAPLAKKLHRAYHTIEKLRDICREDGYYRQGIRDEKEAIYRSVERGYVVDDIRKRLGLDPDEERDCWLELHGIKPEDIAADRRLMDRIIERLGKCEGDDYYENIGYSIEKALEDAIESGEIEAKDDDEEE